MMNRSNREKWYKDYIQNVDSTNIEWIKLDYDGLMKFYYTNYYDDYEECFAGEMNGNGLMAPIGLTYLTFNKESRGISYILGIVKNNIGTKTIVACMIYYDKYLLIENQEIPVTYIQTVETNKYFQHQGIFKKLVSVMLRFIDNNRPILVTNESAMGKQCQTVNLTKNVLISQGFSEDIREESMINENYLGMLQSKTKIK